jgi:hypothetical protein
MTTIKNKPIKEVLRTLEQNRILNHINDIWKADPSLKLSDILPFDKEYSDSEIEKQLKEKSGI